MLYWSKSRVLLSSLLSLSFTCCSLPQHNFYSILPLSSLHYPHCHFSLNNVSRRKCFLMPPSTLLATLSLFFRTTTKVHVDSRGDKRWAKERELTTLQMGWSLQPSMGRGRLLEVSGTRRSFEQIHLITTVECEIEPVVAATIVVKGRCPIDGMFASFFQRISSQESG